MGSCTLCAFELEVLGLDDRVRLLLPHSPAYLFYSVVTGRSGQRVSGAMLIVWIVCFSLGSPFRWNDH